MSTFDRYFRYFKPVAVCALAAVVLSNAILGLSIGHHLTDFEGGCVAVGGAFLGWFMAWRYGGSDD